MFGIGFFMQIMFACHLEKQGQKKMKIIMIPKEKLDFLESSISEIKDMLQTMQPVQKSPKWIDKPEVCKRLNICFKALDILLKLAAILIASGV